MHVKGLEGAAHDPRSGKALTGQDFDGQDLLEISERVYTLQRMFNLREGLSRKDDAVPERAISHPRFGKYKDQSGCATRNYDRMLREYYTASGWDPETGVPTTGTLKRLGLA